MEGINGWLLVYLIGSVPVQLFYAAGLSGWFYDYPMGLFVGIFLVLAVPLVIVVLKIPSAPAWNIAALCTAPGFLDTSLTISGSFGRRSRKRRTRMPQDRRGGVSPYLG